MSFQASSETCSSSLNYFGLQATIFLPDYFSVSKNSSEPFVQRGDYIYMCTSQWRLEKQQNKAEGPVTFDISSLPLLPFRHAGLKGRHVPLTHPIRWQTVRATNSRWFRMQILPRISRALLVATLSISIQGGFHLLLLLPLVCPSTLLSYFDSVLLLYTAIQSKRTNKTFGVRTLF